MWLNSKNCCHATPRVDIFVFDTCHDPACRIWRPKSPGWQNGLHLRGTNKLMKWCWMNFMFKRNDHDLRWKNRCLTKEPCKPRHEAENLWQLPSSSNLKHTQTQPKNSANTTATISQRPTKKQPRKSHENSPKDRSQQNGPRQFDKLVGKFGTPSVVFPTVLPFVF